MKPRRITLFVIVFAASVTAAPVHAELYKWVDERGVTHYSDQRPTEPKAATRVAPVADRVSIYSPDKSLLRAVEAFRLDGSRPAPVEPYRRAPHPGIPAAQHPIAYDPCQVAACTGVSEVHYPYPYTEFVPLRRRPPHLVQAVLPPGAIAGTINSNGTIPGNSAGAGSAVPETMNPGPRTKPLATRLGREPSRR